MPIDAGDSALVAETVVQRAEGGQRQHVVSDPVQADDDGFTRDLWFGLQL